jgi:hypothetical protein
MIYYLYWFLFGLLNVERAYHKNCGARAAVILFLLGPIGLIILLFVRSKSLLTYDNKIISYYEKVLKRQFYKMFSRKQYFAWVISDLRKQNFKVSELRVLIEYVEGKIEESKNPFWLAYVAFFSSTLTSLTVLVLSTSLTMNFIEGFSLGANFFLGIVAALGVYITYRTTNLNRDIRVINALRAFISSN